LACFALLVTRATGTSYWIGSAAALLHEITLLPTFFHIYEIPSDFTDSAIFSLLILAALRGRRYAFTLLIFIGALNRESAVFGVVRAKGSKEFFQGIGLVLWMGTGVRGICVPRARGQQSNRWTCPFFSFGEFRVPKTFYGAKLA
jgi:hypothetical protein